MLPTLPHEMILASAGSGKTWQLTNRYIALMALQLRSGQPIAPERILAATFTKKAAGEFFDSILVKLAEAASSPKKATELSSDQSDPLAPVLADLQPEDYTRLLRVFISRMPRLFLGTLDSFFANLLRAFPAEFGLTGDFETMDEYQSSAARAQVYELVFRYRPGTEKGDENAQHAFLEAFRLATLGSEENRVSNQLDTYIKNLHDLYLSASSAELWGVAETIWSDGGSHWFPGKIDPQEEGERLHKALESLEASGQKIDWKYWNELIEQIADFRPGMPLTTRINYFAERVLPLWSEINSGAASLKINRTVHELNRAVCEPLQRIFQWIVGGELRIKLDRTRGVRELLHHYESTYANEVRRRGLLTFQDIQLLLSRQGYEGSEEAPLFSQLPSEEERLRIDYRLDARYDHWLLDEFQDTNPLQWKVIENLIDEVVQDTSGMRSLFQVGDLKQAIYAWRGGDTRLFTEIAARYNSHGERIQSRHLDISWRSGHDVIDPVNRLFGDQAALSNLGIPQPALEQWIWHPHQVSPKGESYEGCTYLLNPLNAEGGKGEQDDVYALIAGILEEIDPIRRGISCAILVQTNKNGEKLVDALRSLSKIPVVSESEIFIATDNPLCRALMSILQVAAHPGDSFAWEHLKMGPLRERFASEEITVHAFSSQVLRSLFESNFETLVREWVSEFEQVLGSPLDAFTRGRAEEFALAARIFDESGSRDIDEFLAYVGDYRTREAVTGEAVQVMTIHKSKGLTFDAVILPDLGGDSLDIARREIGAKRSEGREVEWILDLPRKEFVLADPVLAEYYTDREAEAAYESLCKFYVALTRASRANYMITLPRGRTSSSRNFVKLLEDTLATEPSDIEFNGVPATVLFASETPQTNRHWYESFHLTEAPEAAPAPEPVGVDRALARFRPRRRTPSGSETSLIPAGLLFSRRGGEARGFGTLVHALFEEIEWADELDWAALEDHCRAHYTESPSLDEALAQVREALSVPELAQALAKPSPLAEHWRERNFEILLGEEWLSGTFDRVVIERDEAGSILRASILDYKSDRVESDEEIETAVDKYRNQLSTYREVLARMTGLSTSNIECLLLFTRAQTLRAV